MTFTGLWDARDRFEAARIGELPEAARRYLEHAIARGTILASSVRLSMRGEIKTGRSWRRFTGEQIIHRNLEFAWNARTKIVGIPTRTIARLISGRAAVLWKIFHVLPIYAQTGRDVTRSAAGRAMFESIWLPSALLASNVVWTAITEARPRAHLHAQHEFAEIAFKIASTGSVETVELQRWGNPGGGEFRYRPFGGLVEAERTFNGYTIPSRLRVGYYAGTERFEDDGEFLRVSIDGATYS